MGTSGNPAKKAAAKKPAPRSTVEQNAQVSDLSEFKKAKEGRILPLPSSLVVRARRIELKTFLKQGAVPNPLMTIVAEALEKGKNTPVEKLINDDEGAVDLDRVREMFELVNEVVCTAVMEPKVHPELTDEDVSAWNEENPDETVDNPEDLKDDDKLYVDEMDDEDKMFIFQWVIGGTDDIDSFREEAIASLAPLGQG